MNPQNENSDMTQKSARRKRIDAVSLSALLPGLGHIYLGLFQRGILWIGATTALMITAVLTLLFQPGGAGFTIAMTLLAIASGVSIVCLVQTWRLATAQRDEPYQLREYNRWYVYVTFILIASFGGAIGLAYVLQTRVVQAFVVPTKSMMPTIKPGSRIAALKEVYLDRDPERGELVVFRSPKNRRKFWIKRVIAVAGDQIEWRADGEILVNGSALPRKPEGSDSEFTERNGGREYSVLLVPTEDGNPPTPEGSVSVPPGHCFVLGDNRNNSNDSRHFGTVSYSSLTASPVLKISGGFGKLK